MKKRSKFSLSNFHNMTGKMGFIYPVNLTEVLPGDSIQQSTSVFLRLAPMVAPVMHPVHMVLHHFYVPARILWDDFEDFITGGPDGMNASVPPTVQVAPSAGSLADAFGLPLSSAALTVSALPFRAYNMIWNEYYRDQDLQAELPISLESGADTTTPLNMLRPCWTKDYFTTARPWPQKGPAVTVPVQGDTGGDPQITATTTLYSTGDYAPKFQVGGAPGKLYSQGEGGSNVAQNDITFRPDLTGAVVQGVLQWSDLAIAAKTDINYKADTPGVGVVDIRDLREAFALQRYEEKRAMYGSRYEDLLRTIGVRPQDARLQMPEYLGGSSEVVQFSEVLQTSAGEHGGVGDLYGHGIGAMKSNRYRRFIPEHGYIMTLLMVRPIPVYSQGVERMWSRKTKEDYWTLELQHIGQQEVLNKEVYADGSADDEKTFGFQNRYDEYRRGVNIVAGEFRTNQDFWTMARVFANRPALNSDFVECHPTDRIFQVMEQNSDQLYMMVKNNVVARRLVDRNGNPM